MRVIKTIGLYTLGILVFPYSWAAEQPGIIKYAYWDSIGSAHEHVKKLWKR